LYILYTRLVMLDLVLFLTVSWFTVLFGVLAFLLFVYVVGNFFEEWVWVFLCA